MSSQAWKNESKAGTWDIEFALPEEAPELEALLTEAGMGLWGAPEEYVIMKNADRIVGCAKLVFTGLNTFHLETLVINPEVRGRGWGEAFLLELLRRPWAYCERTRYMPFLQEEAYRITVVARGAVAGFYRRYGFRDYTFEGLPSPYREQCDGCEEFPGCNPVPLRFIGRVR